MNTELQAIENSIVDWTKLARTGEDKPEHRGVKYDCHLCQYSVEVTEQEGFERCEACPYYKKYGRCDTDGHPYAKWERVRKWERVSGIKERRPYAQAFLDQLKVLAYEAQRPEPKKAEKPKLRHGDYQKVNSGDCIWLKDAKDVLRPFTSNMMCGSLTNQSYDDAITPLGNIFKELAALKPLKEYSTGDGMRVWLNKDGDLRFSCSYVINRNVHDFILNLRCMEAQMIQDAAKQ